MSRLVKFGRNQIFLALKNPSPALIIVCLLVIDYKLDQIEFSSLYLVVYWK